MEYNRNLNSVIESIQDEGPSSTVKDGSSGGSDSVDDMCLDKPVVQRKDAGRSVLQIFSIALLAGLVVAGGVLFVVGGSDGYFLGAPDNSSTTTAAGKQAVDGYLVEIRGKQTQLGNRVDQLAVAIADINIIINQWHGQQWYEQQAVQDDVQSGGKDSTPDVSLAAPDQQGLLLPRNNNVVEAPIAEADELHVPHDEMSAAAVIRPDVVATPGIQAGAAITEPDPAAATEPDVDTTVTEPTATGHSGEQEWVINVAYCEEQESIQELMAKFGQAGITIEQQQVTIDGKTGYRLRIPGFSTNREASEYAKKSFGDNFRLKGPWVGRR